VIRVKSRLLVLVVRVSWLAEKPGCHSGARRRREPGIQQHRNSLFVWIPGPPLRGGPE